MTTVSQNKETYHGKLTAAGQPSIIIVISLSTFSVLHLVQKFDWFLTHSNHISLKLYSLLSYSPSLFLPLHVYTTALSYLKSSLWTSTENGDGQLVIDLFAKNRQKTII